MQSLSILNRRIKKFIKLKFKIKSDFVKVFFYTAFYRAFILFFPFNKLRKKIGNYNEESPTVISDDAYEEARHVGWVVNIISKHTPWESKCLVQALTAQRLLKKRNISSTLYLGIQKDKDNKMLAHAWLRTGSYIVTGGVIIDKFTVVAKFSIN